MEIDCDESMLDMSGNEAFSMDWAYCDLNELLASISSESSSYDCWNLKENHGENTEELLRNNVDSSAFPSSFHVHNEGLDSLHGDSSCLGDQLKDITEAQVVLSDMNDSTDFVLEPNSSMNGFISQEPFFDAWSDEFSSFDSFEQQLFSETRAKDAAEMCPGEENSFVCSRLTVQDSALTSLFGMNNSLDNNQHSSEASAVTEVDLQSGSSTLHGVSENLEPVDMSEEFLKFSSMDEDDLCQWFDPSPEDSTCRTVSALDNTLSESMEFYHTSSGLVGSSSITTAVNSDGKGISAVMHGHENSLLECIEVDLSSDKGAEIWGNMLTPVVSAAADTGFTDCMPELDVDTLKGLLSELEIEELLTGEANYNPLNSSYFDHELSANEVEMEYFSTVNRNSLQLTNLAWSEARANLMQPISDLDKTSNLIRKNDTLPKLQVGLCMDDNHSIKLGETVLVHPQKKEEPKKPIRKKARPGESTRPRPKDRQRIQDSIQQLRKIIPGKDVKECSIDHLLECSIRYMIFLESIAYYENKLQEPDKPKLIDRADGVVLEDSSVGNSKSCDGTWSFEVAGQTLVCPIIVEDMDHPGQMLIEMLCEEQGFSLELADIIKGLGLNILKAKMEIRNKKLWARFIVEQANRHMTRIDVFWSLLHLLQQKNTSGMDSANNHCNVNDANISGLYRQLPEKNSCRYSWP